MLNILAIISVLCMRYKISNTVLLFGAYSTFEVFQGSYSSPILNHAFNFWFEKYFELPWKSDPAKIATGPARPVSWPPPLKKTYAIQTML